MNSTRDRAEIEALFQKLASAHADHDAEAIVEVYTPDAVIFDLAPPLGRRGMNRDNVAAWLGRLGRTNPDRCARRKSYSRR